MIHINIHRIYKLCNNFVHRLTFTYIFYVNHYFFFFHLQYIHSTNVYWSDCKQVSILSLLSVTPNEAKLEQDLNELFGELNGDSIDKSKAYDRIVAIDSVYRLFIKQTQLNQARGQKDGASFYDAVNQGLGNVYNVTSLLQDFNYVIKHENILIEAEKKLAQNDGDNNGNVCTAISCISITRNYRPRNVFGRIGADTFNKLYSVSPTNKANEESCPKFIDKVYIFIYCK